MSSDQEILSNIKQGDEQAFEQLYKRYSLRLRNFASRYVGEQNASDIVQEAFLKLWSKRVFLHDSSVAALLYSIVRNSCLDYLKHRLVVSRHESTIISKNTSDERLYSADFTGDAETKLLYTELREQVEAAISSLSERCREVFLLSRFDGLKNREIAAQLGISTTAVEKHISRALAALSLRVSKHYKIPSHS